MPMYIVVLLIFFFGISAPTPALPINDTRARRAESTGTKQEIFNILRFRDGFTTLLSLCNAYGILFSCRINRLTNALCVAAILNKVKFIKSAYGTNKKGPKMPSDPSNLAKNQVFRKRVRP